MHSNPASLPKTSSLRTALLLSALLLGAAASMKAGAAEYGKEPTRLYVGGAIGRSSYSLPSSSRVPVPWGGEKNSKSGTAFKVYGGYRFTDTFGVEGGYARLGRVKQWNTSYSVFGANSVLENGTGQVFYAAATARLPLGESFALNGRLGVAHGRVSAGNNHRLFGGESIGGNGTGLMAGFGAEYAVTRNLSITADYDYFGKVSKHAKAGLLTVGVRANF
ncbi:outer membrane beta-barrel protein [Variovorax paradoxus]|uniref:outer membrane beta-barrel protein n=1 Tax=Variovorax TaxID=34072 RepID=UPI001ABCAF69